MNTHKKLAKTIDDLTELLSEFDSQDFSVSSSGTMSFDFDDEEDDNSILIMPAKADIPVNTAELAKATSLLLSYHDKKRSATSLINSLKDDKDHAEQVKVIQDLLDQLKARYVKARKDLAKTASESFPQSLKNLSDALLTKLKASYSFEFDEDRLRYYFWYEDYPSEDGNVQTPMYGLSLVLQDIAPKDNQKAVAHSSYTICVRGIITADGDVVVNVRGVTGSRLPMQVTYNKESVKDVDKACKIAFRDLNIDTVVSKLDKLDFPLTDTDLNSLQELGPHIEKIEMLNAKTISFTFGHAHIEDHLDDFIVQVRKFLASLLGIKLQKVAMVKTNIISQSEIRAEVTFSLVRRPQTSGDSVQSLLANLDTISEQMHLNKAEKNALKEFIRTKA